MGAPMNRAWWDEATKRVTKRGEPGREQATPSDALLLLFPKPYPPAAAVL